MPLANTEILNKTAPFFVILLSSFLLGEKLNKSIIIALLTAFIGANFVIQPNLHNINLKSSLIALLSAFFAGTAYTYIRLLKGKEKSQTILFFFSFISLLLSFPFLFIDQYSYTLKDIIILSFIGVLSISTQLGLTLGYSKAKNSNISIFSYSSILFSLILSYIFYQETINFYSLVGSVLIISSAFFLLFKK